MHSALYRADALCRGYGPSGSPVAALAGVSLAIDSGSFTAITGPSGSGKSTLLNILGLLDTGFEGSLRFRNDDVRSMNGDELAALRNCAVGFVFQSFQLLPRVSALGNVELPLRYGGIGPRERRRRAEEALGRVGLEHRAAHLPSELSGGEQQRVAIARAIVNHPAVILADEPTGSLDTATGEEILALLASLNARGTTVIVVTHSEVVAGCARDRIALQDGRLDDPLRR